MMNFCRSALIAAIAVSLLLPATAPTEAAAKKHTRVVVHPKHWRGYGFLPGYHQPPAIADWRPRSAFRIQRDEYVPRYWHYGQITYGWGYPGYYRGRYNGGSFGPCWAYTPIGMMPTCGQ